MTKLQENLQNKAVAPAKKSEDTIFDLIKKSKPAFQMALGKNLDPERFTRIALTVVKQNPKLMQCSAMSLLGALMSSAQLGLEPNILGQSYIIPRKNRGIWEANFQIGYKGLIKLFYNAKNALSLEAREVYENDDFHFEYGLNSDITHKPAMENRGEVIAYYAVAKLKDGASTFAVMSVSDIKENAKKYSDSYSFSYSPWVKNFDEMAKKTVIKQALKYMPLETEKQMALDETTKHYSPEESINLDMTEVPDVTDYEEVEAEEVTNDVETLDDLEKMTRKRED